MAAPLRLSIVTLLAAAALGARVPAPATATIRGTVAVAVAPAPDRPLVSTLGGSVPDPADRRRAVVYLHEAPQQAFEDLRAGRARIDQRGEQFFPRVLAVTAGTVVEFPNSDKTFHNVFSLSRIKTFDLGRYRPGRTGTVTFDRPGIVPIFCDIHANMRAWVLVFRHPYFAVTDEAGRYQIANVPAGTYTVLVWSEVGKPAERRVTITDGSTTEVDFRIGGTS